MIYRILTHIKHSYLLVAFKIYISTSNLFAKARVRFGAVRYRSHSSWASVETGFWWITVDGAQHMYTYNNWNVTNFNWNEHSCWITRTHSSYSCLETSGKEIILWQMSPGNLSCFCTNFRAANISIDQLTRMSCYVSPSCGAFQTLADVFSVSWN